MSRIGKLPIELPAGTTVSINGDFIVVKGKKGELSIKLLPAIKVEIQEKALVVSIGNIENRDERALWGLYRSLINNMVVGVNDGFSKKLEIVGIGYRATLNGNKLVLNLGYSHPIEYELPKGISAVVEKNTITISGADKQSVGETSAQIRKFRKPEPYKGKGIRYSDEIVRRKVGKSATKGA